MIGRRLLVLEKGVILQEEKIVFAVPYLEEAKERATHNAKKYGYVTLVITLRWYFRSTNFFKHKYSVVKTKIKEYRIANSAESGNKETSKFLKVIGEYKGKIRELKHQIKKEENL